MDVLIENILDLPDFLKDDFPEGTKVNIKVLDTGYKKGPLTKVAEVQYIKGEDAIYLINPIKYANVELPPS